MLRPMSHPRKLPHFPPAIIEEIIKLAWADTMPFEVIKTEYGLTENQVRTLMRAHQTEKTRVEARAGNQSKHSKLTTKTSARMKY